MPFQLLFLSFSASFVRFSLFYSRNYSVSIPRISIILYLPAIYAVFCEELFGFLQNVCTPLQINLHLFNYIHSSTFLTSMSSETIILVSRYAILDASYELLLLLSLSEGTKMIRLLQTVIDTSHTAAEYFIFLQFLEVLLFCISPRSYFFVPFYIYQF